MKKSILSVADRYRPESEDCYPMPCEDEVFEASDEEDIEDDKLAIGLVQPKKMDKPTPSNIQTHQSRGWASVTNSLLSGMQKNWTGPKLPMSAPKPPAASGSPSSSSLSSPAGLPKGATFDPEMLGAEEHKDKFKSGSKLYPSSPKGTKPLSHKVYRQVWDAGYEAASWAWSKGRKQVGGTDLFVDAIHKIRDRRVPKHITEDHPQFWEYVGTFIDGARAFAVGQDGFQVRKGAFDPEQIGAESHGALRNEKDEPYMNTNFSGQIFRELADRQNAGQLSDGKPIPDQRDPDPGRKGIKANTKTADLRLSSKDKFVIAAFTDGVKAESKKLYTDGKQLDGLWMGGNKIAYWKNGQIHLGPNASRSIQTVQRALQKYAPRNDFAKAASTKIARKLHKRQEKILEKWLASGGKGPLSGRVDNFDLLPTKVQDDLRRVKDSETLWSDVERWINDNNNPHLQSKWATLKLALDKLPEDTWKYFEKVPKTILIDIDKLIPSRARPKGIANANKFMLLAYQGDKGRRKPLDLEDNGDGTYTVLDGNSTYANAKHSKWKKLPGVVVKKASKRARTAVIKAQPNPTRVAYKHLRRQAEEEKDDYITLIPANGRDYSSKDRVIRDYRGNFDFEVDDIDSPLYERNVTMRDIQMMPQIKEVRLKYKLGNFYVVLPNVVPDSE